MKSGNRGKIKVADITLAHLSRGLYRSNATVFKELINNAYDADATVVRIDTNYPHFNFISCVDNGVGMTEEKFFTHFDENGIGSSVKRKGNTDCTPIHNRPIIGRLGIGMMAIGQLCHSFKIESHYQNLDGVSSAFRATVILTDDDIEDEEDIIRKDNFSGKEIDVGEWEFEAIEFDPNKKGLRVYSSDIRGTFRREMKESLTLEGFKKLPFNIEEIAKNYFYKSKSIRDCKPYLETIWELSSLCPLPYSDNDLSPLNFHKNSDLISDNDEVFEFLKERNELLESYKFEVFFDGVSLKRSIKLPTEKDVKPRIYFFNFDKNIFEKRLKFTGYLFVQIPKAIKPYELKGLQVRLRNVGIGGYDPSFLRYSRRIETIRSQWVSGEVFVDEGLETALNIDRDSFNEHEEHFKAMQRYLHDLLDEIFDEARKAAIELNDVDHDLKNEATNQKIIELVESGSKGKLSLVLDSLNTDRTIISDPSISKVVLNLNTTPIGKSRKKGNEAFRLSMLAFEIAKRMALTEEERESLFENFLKNFIKETI